jgi:hypothetical protein
MKVDYLICGAGATGMSFLDVILAETDATVAIVDRRDAPGGHWNDAYSFVRLHQSSSFYGVCSKPMNKPRKPDDTVDAATFELASKSEVLHYFHDLMENTYLPSGRVTYLPMSEYLGEGRVRSLVSGDVTEIEIAKKFVNTGTLSDLASIPALHKRSCDVAGDVACVTPNDLSRHVAGHDRFTVIGAGKTAMDAVVWLLRQGADADQITWVKPSDYWLFNRDQILNHPSQFMTTMSAFQGEIEALATSATVAEFCDKMEHMGVWHRTDADVTPTKFHAATCSLEEMALLRSVKNVVRKGRVTAIEPERLILAQGEVPVQAGMLYVDCSASGGAVLGKGAPPIFDGDTINLFMIRCFQPLFSAAVIAFLEAHMPDEKVRRACTRTVDFHHTPAEYIQQMMIAIINQGTWSKVPPLKAWLETCRLNAVNHLMVGFSPEDTEKLALLSRFGPLSQAAVENIPKMLAAEHTG